MAKLRRRQKAEEQVEEKAQIQKDPIFMLPKDKIPLDRQWELLAKNDYAFYVEYVHHRLYKHGVHTRYICSVLEQVERGEIDRLIITLPPRHSKSMTVSETFPSWFIGRDPSRRVIEVSYGDRLAKRFGRLNKAKIKEFGPKVFGVSLPEWGTGTQSSTDWGVEGHRGGMLCAGIGGSITGEGAHLLLIDDPIKNREEAYSAVYREKIWEEWKNTLLTRLMPGGVVIIILTRWHEDDLVGRILSPKYNEGGEEDIKRWKIISLPAECEEEEDVIGRKKGDFLWPEYGFDKKWAAKTKRDVGSKTWNSLYQQRPTAVEGEYVKRYWWKEYNAKHPPEFIEIVQSWDCAYEEEANLRGSYTVCTTWGRTSTAYYLLDVYRKKIEFPELIRMMKSLYAKYEPSAVVVEYKASGKSAFQALRRQTAIPLIKDNPHKSKLVRLEIVSPMIEAGLVYLPDLAPWLYDYIEELSAFPGGENDDQVDSTSQALKHFQSHAGKHMVTSDEYEDLEEEKKQIEDNVINIEGLIIAKDQLPEELMDIDPTKITKEDLQRAVMAERYGIS
jgi:predicted phage terminase large subunit-like protein